MAKNRSVLGVGALMCAFLVPFGGVACSSSSVSAKPETISIGFIGGDDADSRLAQLVAVLRDINDAGGATLDGKNYQYKIEFENHEGTPEGAVAAMQRLKDKGVEAVVDPPWSSLILGAKDDHSDGAAAAAKDLDMVIVSGGATSPAITTVDDNNRVFRTIASDAIQGQISAAHIAELGIKTASVVYRDDAWGRGLATLFKSSFEASGGTVLASVAYPPDATSDYDFSAKLAQAFAGDPGAVLLASFEEVYPLANQIDNGGYLAGYADGEPKLVGTDGFFDSQKIVTNMPAPVLDRLIGTIPRSNPTSKDYLAAGKIVEDAVNDGGVDGSRFDAVALLALAIQAAGANDAAKISAVLAEISRKDAGDVDIHVGDWKKARETLLAGGTINYEGASGAIELDDNGDRTVGWIGLWESVKSGGVYSVNDTEIVPYGK